MHTALIINMSRRPANPAADRAAQNQQTIKSLLKLEGNKICADCKRNKRECDVLPEIQLLNLFHSRSKMGELELGDFRMY